MSRARERRRCGAGPSAMVVEKDVVGPSAMVVESDSVGAAQGSSPVLYKP